MPIKVITGVTGDQAFPPCFLRQVRVGGAANLAGTVQIKRGSTVLETLPIGATPGTKREYVDTKFDGNTGLLNISPSNAGDTVVAIFG